MAHWGFARLFTAPNPPPPLAAPSLISVLIPRQEKAPGVMTKVLYVEDNEDNVYMLKMRLELLGDFEVLTAERRRRPEAKLDETIEATLVDPSDDPALAMEMLRRALADLSSDHREIIDLVY
jgi:hypothetical protein